MLTALNLEFLIQNMMTGVVYQDKSGVIVNANRAAEDLLGLSLDQMTGRTSVDDRWRSVKSNGEPFPGDEHPAMVSLRTGKKIEEVIMGVFHPMKNDWVWISINSFPEFDQETNEIKGVFSTFKDITKRKIAEEKLVKTNNELLDKTKTLEGLLHSQTSYFLKTNLEGYITYANGAYISNFSHSHPNGILGSHGFESILPSHHERATEAVQRCLKEIGSVVQVELDKPSSDGRKRTSLWEFSAITDKNGLPHEVLCIGIDITELNESNKKLFQSEEKYRSLVENSENIIITIDRDARILYANNKAAKLIGIEQNKIPDEKVTIGMFYSEKEQKENLKRDLDNLFDKGIGYTKVTSLKVGDRLVWVKGTATPIFNREGKVVSAHVSATDITDQVNAERLVVENEQKYRSLVESSDAIIAMFDLNGKSLYANDVAGRFVGVSPEEAIEKGFSLQDVFPESRRNNVLSDVDQIIRTKKGINEEISLNIGGQDIFFKSSLQPVLNDNNEVFAILLNASDITEQKQNELRLLQSEENYKSLFYNSAHAFLIIQDGVFVDCNLASEKLYGGERADLIGKHPAEISPERQLNGETSVELAARLIERVLREGRVNFEWIHLKKSGETFLAKINLVLGIYNGREAIIVDWQDITEERKNENSVRHLSQIVDQSPVSILSTDVSGNIEYVNESLLKSTGYTREEVMGRNPRIWKSDATPDDRFKELWSTILAGDTWKGEFLNVRKDGSQFYESSTVFPIFDLNGQISSLVGIQEDISERKKVESELRLFRTIFDSAVNGRLIADLEGNILYGNAFYSEMHDCEPSELIGHNYKEFVSETSLAKYKLMLSKLSLGQMIYSTEIEHKRKDGSTFPTLVTIGQLEDERGSLKYLSITVIDISDRKQIENEIIELNYNLEEKVRERTKELETAIERLETFFNQSLDMLCVADQEGKFIKLSRAFESVLHYSRAELEGENYLEFVHPDDIEDTLSAMQSLQSQSTVSQFVNRYRTKEGDYRYIEWYSSPVGEYVYAVARDVTDRMEREQELINARRVAEEANASKSLFLSRMSHELRTPMNSILGFAQLLEMGELNEMQETSVRHILHSGKHLLGLINEVLDIARIETGKMTLSIESVNLTDTIQKTCLSLEPQAEKRKVSIKVNRSLDKPLYVKADQQRVVQILTNIINNAIKYNKEGGSVFIEHEETVDAAGDDVVRVSIKDTGIGINEKDISKLFTPFERIGAENTDVEGTGLGLAVVKELIHVLDGHVGVNSQLGEGTTFWFELPKCTSEILDHTPEEIIGTEHTIANERTASILYVEDNAMNISLVEDIFKLSRPMYELFTTVYGGEAVELAIKHHPKLILLDLDLPDIHGSEVIVQLRENELTKEIPVIVVSADATKNQVSKLMSLGADKYLIKPFDIKEFLDTIDEYIKQ